MVIGLSNFKKHVKNEDVEACKSLLRKPKVKNKIPLERDEQRALVKKLRRRGLFVYAIPNHKEMKENEGALAGIPDLQICLEGGKVIWLELKRTKGGVLSPAQKEVHSRLEALGHTVIVGYGAKDAWEKLAL